MGLWKSHKRSQQNGGYAGGCFGQARPQGTVHHSQAAPSSIWHEAAIAPDQQRFRMEAPPGSRQSRDLNPHVSEALVRKVQNEASQVVIMHGIPTAMEVLPTNANPTASQLAIPIAVAKRVEKIAQSKPLARQNAPDIYSEQASMANEAESKVHSCTDQAMGAGRDEADSSEDSEGKLAARRFHGRSNTTAAASAEKEYKRSKSAPFEFIHQRLTANVLRQPFKDVYETYSFGQELGTGMSATVRKCVSRLTGEELACKTINKSQLLCSEDLEALHSELLAMKTVSSHSAAVNLRGVYEDVENVHLIMELCKGGDLYDRIAKRLVYPERDAARLCRSLVSVVSFCHSRGMMHRDLKPENILLVSPSSHTNIRVADFGQAKFFEPGEKLTRVVGSPYYIAPEVLQGSYGPEADLWSIGIILYILLSGAPPFQGDDRDVIFEGIKNSPLDVENGRWSNISDGAKDLVKRLLARDPEQRITAAEMKCHPWVVYHCRRKPPPLALPLDDAVPGAPSPVLDFSAETPQATQTPDLLSPLAYPFPCGSAPWDPPPPCQQAPNPKAAPGHPRSQPLAWPLAPWPSLPPERAFEDLATSSSGSPLLARPGRPAGPSPAAAKPGQQAPMELPSTPNLTSAYPRMRQHESVSLGPFGTTAGSMRDHGGAHRQSASVPSTPSAADGRPAAAPPEPPQASSPMQMPQRRNEQRADWASLRSATLNLARSARPDSTNPMVWTDSSHLPRSFTTGARAVPRPSLGEAPLLSPRPGTGPGAVPTDSEWHDSGATGASTASVSSHSMSKQRKASPGSNTSWEFLPPALAHCLSMDSIIQCFPDEADTEPSKSPHRRHHSHSVVPDVLPGHQATGGGSPVDPAGSVGRFPQPPVANVVLRGSSSQCPSPTKPVADVIHRVSSAQFPSPSKPVADVIHRGSSAQFPSLSKSSAEGRADRRWTPAGPVLPQPQLSVSMGFVGEAAPAVAKLSTGSLVELPPSLLAALHNKPWHIYDPHDSSGGPGPAGPAGPAGPNETVPRQASFTQGKGNLQWRYTE